MQGTDTIQNSMSAFCVEDSAPPSPKRVKINSKSTNELFGTEGCFKNSTATQSVSLVETQAELVVDGYEEECMSPKSTVQDGEAQDIRYCGYTSEFGINTIERSPIQKHTQTGAKLCVRTSGYKEVKVKCQKLESSNKECLSERDIPYLSHHHNIIGESGYILDYIKTETPVANTFAMQRNSFESSIVPDTPTNECGMHPCGTFTEMEENEFKKDKGDRARLETDDKGDANICNIETKVEVNEYCHNESIAADVDEYADSSVVASVTSSKKSEYNDAENSMELKHGFPSGASREYDFCTATTQTSFVGGEHTTGNGLGSKSQELADIIDVETVMESHICCEADRIQMAQERHITSGCDLLMAEMRSDTKAEKICLVGPVQSSSVETSAVECHETFGEQHMNKYDRISEDVISLAPPREVVSIVNNSSVLDRSPFVERWKLTDGEFLLSLKRDTAVGPADTDKDSPCEVQIVVKCETEVGKEHFDGSFSTSEDITEQRCGRQETETTDHGRIQHQEFHFFNTFCSAETEKVCHFERSDIKLDTADVGRCEVSDPESQDYSNTSHHQRTVNAESLPLKNIIVKALEKEKDCNVIDDDKPVGSTGQELESTCLKLCTALICSATSYSPHNEEWNIEDRGTVVAAADGFCKHEQGPHSSIFPENMHRQENVKENRSTNGQSDTGQKPTVSLAQSASDAVVPVSGSGPVDDILEMYMEADPQSPVRFTLDCVPSTGFDIIEKIPLSLSTEGLQHSPLLSHSPSSPVTAKSQSHSGNVTGHSGEISVPSQPNSGTEQLAESECSVECSLFQEQHTRNTLCSGDVLRSVQGVLHRESQNLNICGLREKHSEQSECDQSLVTFGGSSQFSVFAKPKCAHFDPQERSQIPPLNSKNSDTPQFEMKEKFDLVIEELCLFLNIGKDPEEPLGQISETLSRGERPPKEEVAEQNKDHHSCPPVKMQGRREENQDGCNTVTVRRQPETASIRLGFDHEQEVPFEFGLSKAEGEDSMYSTVNHKESRAAEDGKKYWSPAFVVLPFLNEQNQRLHEPPKRLEPLKTCVRPIRVGLSKRARPKQLHPYFK